MLTSHHARVGTMHTLSHEVVNRVAIKREEDGLSAYHAAKRDYCLTMNRLSSRLPPPPPQPPASLPYDENELSAYCSSYAGSLSVTLRGDKPGDGMDLSEIDGALYERAVKRQNADAHKRTAWLQGANPRVELLLHRELLARGDVHAVEHEFFLEIRKAFFSHPLIWQMDFAWDERRARREIEDLWMSETLCLLDVCAKEHAECVRALWCRAFGDAKKPPQEMRPRSFDALLAELDVMLCQPLQHRSDTIRRETEDEEDIAFRYLYLGERAQRDLVTRGVMRRNRETGLLDSVRHPIAVCDYDEVDLAFQTEFRYLESREETQRMMIVDEFLCETEKLCTERMLA